jgi:hypothetical protein
VSTWKAWIAIAVFTTSFVYTPRSVSADLKDTPRNRWDYNFPSSYDAEIAAPAVHRIRFQDDHIILMEVANPPGYEMQMHGHPYPSIFARSSGRTNTGGKGPTDTYLEPDGNRNGEHWHNALPPKGYEFPLCTAADPQAPHRPMNKGPAPQHFYRIEFKRIDQDNTAHSAHPAASENTLFEDDAVRLVEIFVSKSKRVGPSDPYPAVLAFDTSAAFDTMSQYLGPTAGISEPPDGMQMPRCLTIGPNAPGAPPNSNRAPIHYYRLDFKRIEGDELKDHWREWYPFMTDMR